MTNISQPPWIFKTLWNGGSQLDTIYYGCKSVRVTEASDTKFEDRFRKLAKESSGRQKKISKGKGQNKRQNELAKLWVKDSGMK